MKPTPPKDLDVPSTEGLGRLLEAAFATLLEGEVDGDGDGNGDEGPALTLADLIQETRQPMDLNAAHAAGPSARRLDDTRGEEEPSTLIAGPVRDGHIELSKVRTPEGHYRFVARAASLALRGQVLHLAVEGVVGSPLVAYWRRSGGGVEAEFFIPSARHPPDEQTPFALVAGPRG